MAKPKLITASLAQLRAWRDRTSLNVLTISMILAVVVGVILYFDWEKLTGAGP